MVGLPDIILINNGIYIIYIQELERKYGGSKHKN